MKTSKPVILSNSIINICEVKSPKEMIEIVEKMISNSKVSYDDFKVTDCTIILSSNPTLEEDFVTSGSSIKKLITDIKNYLNGFDENDVTIEDLIFC